MTARARLTWTGAAVLRGTRAGAVRGLRLSAEHILERARARVPIEEGTLERSGVASVDEETLTAGVSFDTPYAARVHEDLNARHDDGRTAKFLEGPVTEEAGTVAEILAAEMRRALRG
ncbi:hypothetical protein ACFWAA_33430 [Streptomyces sp. NPDC059922]|uniref:hypothetical protein n=1 Tax=Streptomyces sp. NPDC059922 TaxID=3347005 RepID=UPI00364BDA16